MPHPSVRPTAEDWGWSASPLEMSKPYFHQLESEVFHMVTGTAQVSYLLAGVLQELWHWADNVLPPNVISEERDCQGPSPASIVWFSML